MKVLQLCHKSPQPSIDGGCIAINNITRGLISNDISVKVLTISTSKHPFHAENFTKEYLDETNIEAAFVDTELNVVDAFSSLVTSDSYNISRFFSPDFDILLRKTLEKEKFDVIHLESLFMTPYIHTVRRFSKGKIILRSHNLEYMIWERLANATINPAKKIYLKILAKQLKKYEINILNSIDGIAAISKEDKAKYVNLGCKKPIETVPFGIDIENYTPSDNTRNLNENLKLFHLGAMDWKPNLEGISWFLESVWKPILSKKTKTELHLAGRSMPKWLIEYDVENLINHREVASANDFMNSNHIMVVPLLSAGGMRVKIIEGMALGKVIISTKIGAEGINYKNRENILIADTPEEFNAQIEWLHENPKKIAEIGNEARRLVQTYYNNHAIAKHLLSFYESTLKG